MSKQLFGRILSADGWVTGTISFDNTIHAIIADAQVGQDKDLPIILPGFIDLHLHGGMNADIMHGATAAHTTARIHAKHGTTSFLATTMTAPVPEIIHALKGVAHCMAHPDEQGADILGVHLEGPYINSKKLGAQPNYAIAATINQITEFNAISPLRVITLAAEVHQHLALIPHLIQQGWRVQLGHSNSSYDETVAAMQAGATGFTHLFNAMTALHHRSPGMVGAALAHADYAEIIPDLVHVHSGALLATARAIPKLYAVTDATAATGMPDGTYELGSQHIYKCAGCVRLADGGLAGSILTMDQALRNLLKIGIPLERASHMLSLFPAQYLGLKDRGTLSPHYRADVVVLDRTHQIQQVFIHGNAILLNT